VPELRKDPITGRWVIISTDRGKRPTDFLRESVLVTGPKNCPFCPGAESKTPPEILVYGRNGGGANTSGWNIRVVPNRFPALGIEGDLDREGEGLFDKMNGVGAHEVIVESPDHMATLATLQPRAVEDVLWAYRDRMLDLKKRQALPLRPHLQKSRRSRRRFHRASAFATHRSAHRSAPRPRGSRQLLALLRRKRALHFLRHHSPGARHRRARHRRKRTFHFYRAVRIAFSIRDVAATESSRLVVRK